VAIESKGRMSAIHVLAATDRQLPDARALVFEYMAATQHEAGRTVPAGIDLLPGVLLEECTDLATAYQPPGTLLLAYQNHEPIGCVGLKPMPPPGTIEVRRLYVRPAHRRGGVARMLMHHAHRHAARHGFTRLVLDVMPTRTLVIDFYRRLGYTGAEPYPTEAPDPMIYLQRPADLYT
jgi:ribosomal protein S18 acetylase RimI-like enzyme